MNARCQHKLVLRREIYTGVYNGTVESVEVWHESADLGHKWRSMRKTVHTDNAEFRLAFEYSALKCQKILMAINSLNVTSGDCGEYVCSCCFM